MAVRLYAVLMLVIAPLAAPLGLIGGFAMGALNALLIGATLSLVEQAVMMKRQIRFQDVWASLGHYFWEVMGVLFILWIPLFAL